MGFELPPTLFTNDPDEFLDLYRECNGRLVSKITSTLALRPRFGSEFSRFTEMVSTRDVANAHSVSLCPIVLQGYVAKRVEVRVTVVGQQVFAAEIHSQATHRTRVDWRRYDLGSTPHRVHALPADVAARCTALVADAGLTFGTIDLILTPDGRYVFLELNSAGEYGWIEDLTGLPISDAIADFLLGDQAAAPQIPCLQEEACHA
jgi:glutathione synthase/RimK-type ligase-like ATP-grasp enzyme